MATATLKTDNRVLMTTADFAERMGVAPTVAIPMVKALRDKGKINVVGKTKVTWPGKAHTLYHFPNALVKVLF